MLRQIVLSRSAVQVRISLLLTQVMAPTFQECQTPQTVHSTSFKLTPDATLPTDVPQFGTIPDAAPVSTPNGSSLFDPFNNRCKCSHSGSGSRRDRCSQQRGSGARFKRFGGLDLADE
jgi:hypothetical protein